MSHAGCVLCVPASHVHALGGPGVEHRSDLVGWADTLLAPAAWKDRATVESDPSWLQVIPYVAVIRGEPASEPDRVLVYDRGDGGGEARLAERVSLGVGGHVESCDSLERGGCPVATVDRAAARELAEELGLYFHPSTLRRRGWFYTQESPVSRVHLAVTYTAMLPSALVLEASTGMNLVNARLVRLDRAAEPRLEPWSQVFLAGLAGSSAA